MERFLPLNKFHRDNEIKLEHTMLREVNQKESDKHRIVSHDGVLRNTVREQQVAKGNRTRDLIYRTELAKG